MKNTRWLTSTDLLKQLQERGASWCSRAHMHRLEEQGKLSLPRFNNSRRDRVVTQEMIDDIVKAFSPGGKGHWHLRDFGLKEPVRARK